GYRGPGRAAARDGAAVPGGAPDRLGEPADAEPGVPAVGRRDGGGLAVLRRGRERALVDCARRTNRRPSASGAPGLTGRLHREAVWRVTWSRSELRGRNTARHPPRPAQGAAGSAAAASPRRVGSCSGVYGLPGAATAG